MIKKIVRAQLYDSFGHSPIRVNDLPKDTLYEVFYISDSSREIIQTNIPAGKLPELITTAREKDNNRRNIGIQRIVEGIAA